MTNVVLVLRCLVSELIVFTPVWCSIGFSSPGFRLSSITIKIALTTVANATTGRRYIFKYLTIMFTYLCWSLTAKVLPHGIPELIYMCAQDYGALDFKVVTTFILQWLIYCYNFTVSTCLRLLSARHTPFPFVLCGCRAPEYTDTVSLFLSF